MDLGRFVHYIEEIAFELRGKLIGSTFVSLRQFRGDFLVQSLLIPPKVLAKSLHCVLGYLSIKDFPQMYFPVDRLEKVSTILETGRLGIPIP